MNWFGIRATDEGQLFLAKEPLMSVPPLPRFPQINQATHDQALVLQSALQNIPNPASECMLRNVAIRLAQQISDEVSRGPQGLPGGLGGWSAGRVTTTMCTD